MGELLKSRHSFGSEYNIDSALDQGLIDAYDILFLKEGKIGWIDSDGKKVILEDKTGVTSVDVLPEIGSKEMVYIYDSKFYFWDGTGFKTPTIEVENKVVEVIVNEKIDAAVSDIVDKVNAYTDEQIANAVKSDAIGESDIDSLFV